MADDNKKAKPDRRAVMCDLAIGGGTGYILNRIIMYVFSTRVWTDDMWK